MYCSKCGSEIQESAKFCPSCGQSINDTADDVVKKTASKWKQLSKIGCLSIIATVIILIGVVLLIGIFSSEKSASEWKHCDEEQTVIEDAAKTTTQSSDFPRPAQKETTQEEIIEFLDYGWDSDDNQIIKKETLTNKDFKGRHVIFCGTVKSVTETFGAPHVILTIGNHGLTDYDANIEFDRSQKDVIKIWKHGENHTVRCQIRKVDMMSLLGSDIMCKCIKIVE